MKTTLRYFLERTYLLIIVIMLVACSQNEHARKSATIQKDPKYSYEYIKKISLTQPKRALGILDKAEKHRLMSSLDINTLRSIVYNNAFQDFYTAAEYASKALEDKSADKNPERQQKLYSMAAAQYYNCGNYTESLNMANKGIDMAYKYDNRQLVAQLLLTVGECHSEVGNTGHALNSFDRCIEIIEEEKNKETDWDILYDLVTALSVKANLLADLKDYKALFKMENTYSNYLTQLNDMQEDVSGANDISNAAFYSIYSIAYERTGNHIKARACFDKLLATRIAIAPEGATYVIPYLIETKKYAEALKKIKQEEETWMKNRRDSIDFNFSHNILMNKARILQATGKYKEAIETGMKAYNLSDSLTRRIKNQNATWMSEEMGKKILNRYIERQEKQLTVNRAANIIMGTLLFICIILIFFIVRDNKLIKDKNRASSDLISELSLYKKELFRRIKNNEGTAGQTLASVKNENAEDGIKDGKLEIQDISDSDPVEINDDMSEKNRQDYEKFLNIERMIFERSLFVKPKLSKQDIAAETGISLSALNQLFSKFSKISFNNYLNNLRMERAAKLLREKQNYSIEAIAQECGVPVRQTFYRLFAKKFGMTPAEYRSNINGWGG